MNPTTKQPIQTNKKARNATRTTPIFIIGVGLVCIGMLLLVIKGMSVEYIDAHEILHENFFLIPIGFACIFFGVLTLIYNLMTRR